MCLHAVRMKLPELKRAIVRLCVCFFANDLQVGINGALYYSRRVYGSISHLYPAVAKNHHH